MAHTKTPHKPVRIRADLHARIKKLADAEDRSIQKMLNRILGNALDNMESKKDGR